MPEKHQQAVFHQALNDRSGSFKKVHLLLILAITVLQETTQSRSLALGEIPLAGVSAMYVFTGLSNYTYRASGWFIQSSKKIILKLILSMNPR